MDRRKFSFLFSVLPITKVSKMGERGKGGIFGAFRLPPFDFPDDSFSILLHLTVTLKKSFLRHFLHFRAGKKIILCERIWKRGCLYPVFFSECRKSNYKYSCMPYHAKYCFFQEDISFRGTLMCYSIGLGFSLNTKSPVTALSLFHQEKPRKGTRRKRKNKRAKKGSSWFPQRSWHYLSPPWNQRRRSRKLRNWLKKEVNLKPPFLFTPPFFQILWFREEA